MLVDVCNIDGIDFGVLQDIIIVESYICIGDDNIVIKVGRGVICYVLIFDDYFYWGYGLFIGSEINVGVSDIFVCNVMFDGMMLGFRIKSDVGCGGLVIGVCYEDVCLCGNKKLIDFDMCYDDKVNGGLILVFENIMLQDVIGIDGIFVFCGYDVVYLFKVLFDGVCFSDWVKWQIENV